jgi:hypothetical protein
MRVYLGLFWVFLNSLIGLIVKFIRVLVINFSMLCENFIKLN